MKNLAENGGLLGFAYVHACVGTRELRSDIYSVGWFAVGFVRVLLSLCGCLVDKYLRIRIVFCNK